MRCYICFEDAVYEGWTKTEPAFKVQTCEEHVKNLRGQVDPAVEHCHKPLCGQPVMEGKNKMGCAAHQDELFQAGRSHFFPPKEN